MNRSKPSKQRSLIIAIGILLIVCVWLTSAIYSIVNHSGGSTSTSNKRHEELKEKITVNEEKDHLMTALRKQLADCDRENEVLKRRVSALEADLNGQNQRFDQKDETSPITTIVDVPKPTRDSVYHGVVDHIDPHEEDVIPIVVLAYNRPKTLKKTIDEVLRLMPKGQFRLFVSQDSTAFPEVTTLLTRYADAGRLHHLVHERQTEGMRQIDIDEGWASYYAIAHHYQFVFQEIFSPKFPQYKRIIILEEDLRVGVDFFQYMRATSRLLDDDPSLFCVSSWNDNGKGEFVSDPERLYRTDFFPGLGWMTSRRIWDELSRKWPNGFWDDWLRQPSQRKDRACIRPEVPRTFMSCEEAGASAGQFCDFIIDIKLSETAVNWAARDLHYLVKDRYDVWLLDTVSRATEVSSISQLKSFAEGHRAAKIPFNDNNEFRALAEELGIMTDFKDGVPRTAYKGVVSLRLFGTLVHLYATYVYTSES